MLPCAINFAFCTAAVRCASTGFVRYGVRGFGLVGLACFLALGLVILFVGVKGHVRHRALVEPIAGAPMEFVAHRVPAEEVGAHVGEAGQRQGRVGEAEGQVAEVAVQQAGEIKLVGMVDQGVAAVRREANVGGAHFAFGGIDAGPVALSNRRRSVPS